MGLFDSISRLFGGSKADSIDESEAANVAKPTTDSNKRSETVSNNTKDVSKAYMNNKVGPIIRCGEVADAAVEAAEIDNPDSVIKADDRKAYIRIETDHEMIIKRATLEDMLGRSFEMRELEINLSSFAGLIEMDTDQVRFYLKKKL